MLEISRREFCSNIEAIEQELNIYKTLKDLDIFVERDNRLLYIVIDMLKEKTNDVCEFIEWYLFEQPLNDDDKVVDVTTDSMDIHIKVDSPRKLYELLVLLDEDNVYNDETLDIN